MEFFENGTQFGGQDGADDLLGPDLRSKVVHHKVERVDLFQSGPDKLCDLWIDVGLFLQDELRLLQIEVPAQMFDFTKISWELEDQESGKRRETN